MATTRLLALDSALTGVDVLTDVSWLYDQFVKVRSTDPTLRLDILFQRYMEDENGVANYNDSDKEELIQNSIAIYCGFAMGGCAGAAESALGILKSAVIGFTIEAYTDFFNYVAWLAL